MDSFVYFYHNKWRCVYSMYFHSFMYINMGKHTNIYYLIGFSLLKKGLYIIIFSCPIVECQCAMPIEMFVFMRN